MVRRPILPEDLYNPENDPEIEAIYENAIENSEKHVRWLVRTKRNEIREERLEQNVYKFFDAYFDDQNLSEILDFLDRDINDIGYRNSCWLLSEAIAYNQLNQKYSEKKFDKCIGKIRDIMMDFIKNIPNYNRQFNSDLSLTNKKIKKIYPQSPINRDGTTATLGGITPSNYFMSEFLEISEDIFNEDEQRRRLDEMRSELKTKKRFKLLASPTLFLLDGIGNLYPELYHTLNLAQEYESLETIEGKKVANCFYIRSIELIKSYSDLYTEKSKEECEHQLEGLIELLRDSRENMSI
jgi:hypothetical protein|tara:strand:+ start:289 stop:1176 length:888 start_codon:yes stop_codon:yes gene_type:complete